MAVAFANIFMADIETQIVSQSVVKPFWKRFIDDILSLWDTGKHDIERFIEQANSYHPTTEFTAEISNAETTFLYTVVYKGNLSNHHACQSKIIKRLHLKVFPLLEVVQAYPSLLFPTVMTKCFCHDTS